MSKTTLTAVYFVNGSESTEKTIGIEAESGAVHSARFSLPSSVNGTAFRFQSSSFPVAEGEIQPFRYRVNTDPASPGSPGELCFYKKNACLMAEISFNSSAAGPFYLWIVPDERQRGLIAPGSCYCHTGEEEIAASIASGSATIGSRSYIRLTRKDDAALHDVSTHALGITETLCQSAAAYPTLQWEPALDTYAPLLTDAMSTKAIVELTTYINNAEVATRLAELTLTVPADLRGTLQPGWVSLAPHNAGAAEGLSGYISTYSAVQAAFDTTKIDMSMSYGASIEQTYISLERRNYYGLSPLSHVISGEVKVDCTAVDSRGFMLTESFTITPESYAPPALSLISVCRADEEGAANEDGNYCAVRATVSISPLSGQNSVELAAYYCPYGGSYGDAYPMQSGETCLIGPVSPDLSCEIKIEARDVLTKTTAVRKLPTRKWAMKFRPDGGGVAFGKAAEKDKSLELHPDWQLRRGESDAALWLHAIAEADLPAESWQDGRAELPIEGMKETDIVLLDVNDSAALEEFSKITHAESAENAFILYADEAPATSLPLRLLILRL